MSKFVVKDPEVFSTLSTELTKMNQEASNIVLDFNKIVEKFKEDLFKDLKETENQYYEVALELCITWLNRILFLKLLDLKNKYNNEYILVILICWVKRVLFK